MEETGTITLRKGQENRIAQGHPWVFSNEIGEISGSPAAGEVVTVLRAGGRFVGRGFYHPHSLIAVRLLSRQRDEAVDRDLLARRLREARDYRERLYPGASACRLVHGEGDQLPGLVVDRYEGALSVQTFSAGMDLRLELLLDLLEEICAPGAVVERNESPLRDLEGLPRRSGLLRGALDGPVEIEEAGIRMQVDLLGGQKTGGFLDQRENRALVRRWAGGCRVLDAYCHDGGFALQALAGGAESVLAVDSSEAALARAAANAERNGYAGRFEARAGDARATMADLRRDPHSFDLVVLDPPSFTRTRKQVPQAKQGYRALHREAFRLVRRGGWLATASCSHHVREDTFFEVVAAAAREMGCRLRWVAHGMQSPDHPVLPEIPETRYLKFGLFQVL